MKRMLGVGGLVAGMVATMAVGRLWAAGVSTRPGLDQRYGIRVDLKHYPQDDPQQAIRSVIQAAAAGDIEYLLAHLVSPSQVDEKLGGSRQGFRKLVSKATPEKTKKMIEALSRQLRNGTWTIQRNLAWAQADGVPDLSLEKLGRRWFMHNKPVPRPRKR